MSPLSFLRRGREQQQVMNTNKNSTTYKENLQSQYKSSKTSNVPRKNLKI